MAGHMVRMKDEILPKKRQRNKEFAENEEEHD